MARQVSGSLDHRDQGGEPRLAPPSAALRPGSAPARRNCSASHDVRQPRRARRVIVGELPGRALRLVAEWADLHRDELAADWERVLSGSSPEPIDPLP
jgi:hypothetical protein